MVPLDLKRYQLPQLVKKTLSCKTHPIRFSRSWRNPILRTTFKKCRAENCISDLVDGQVGGRTRDRAFRVGVAVTAHGDVSA